MKKFLFSLILLVAGYNLSHAQGNVRFGVNAGIPVGDASDYSDLNVGADIAYLLGFENFQAGPMVGYNHFFIDEGDDLSFIPVAAAARFSLAGLELEADFGYALGVNDGNNGGVYYRPKIGFNLFGIGLVGSYTGISKDGDTASSINVGVEIRI